LFGLFLGKIFDLGFDADEDLGGAVWEDHTARTVGLEQVVRFEVVVAEVLAVTPVFTHVQPQPLVDVLFLRFT
jgi:hypothetical protein